MINFLHKLSLKLQAYRTTIYVIATIVVVNVIYRLIFNQLDNSITMLNLLLLAWVALLNFILHAFKQNNNDKKIFLLTWLKNLLNRGLEYLLMFVFLGLTLATIILSFRLLKLYAA